MVEHALITGGCGFVGRHLTLRLLERGVRVTAIDNLLVGKHPNAWLPPKHLHSPAFTFLESDVRDVFRDDRHAPSCHLPHPFSHVFHLAAVIGGRAVIDGDPMAVATDVSIDADLFAWAVRRKPGRVLYASSSAAYPISLQGSEGARALKEEDLQFGRSLGQPDMTYGWSKMTGEYLASIAAKHYGLSVSCVRPFAGYGEDQDESYPIPALASRAARKEDPFVVWGTGDQGRDFVHIDDCIDAMLLAVERISDGSAVNIGSGCLTSFRDVLRILATFAHYHPTIQPLLEKPVGVHSRYADITRMRELLGWTPTITLEEGLRRVFDAAVSRLHSHVKV